MGVLAIEQGKTNTLFEMSPRDLYRRVLDMLGDQRVHQSPFFVGIGRPQLRALRHEDHAGIGGGAVQDAGAGDEAPSNGAGPDGGSPSQTPDPEVP